MSDNTTLLKIADGVDAMQKSHTALEAKYDGLLNVQIKEIGDKLNPLVDAQAKLDSQLLEAKQEIKTLEATLLRVANSGSKKEEEKNVEYKNAFKSYLRKKTAISDDVSDKYIKSLIEDIYQGSNSKDLDLHLKTLRSDIGPDGGYFIVPQKGEIIKGRYFETTPMRLLADVREITSNQIDFPLDDQEAGAPTWGSEVTPTPGVNTPQIGLINILAHQQSAYVDVTQTMLDDMPDVDTWLLSKLDDKFRRDENTKFVSGDGASKPKGYLSYTAWSTPTTISGTTGVYQRNAVEQIASGVAGELSADGIKTMQAALKEEYQENAVFVMKRMTWNGVTLLKDGMGRWLIDPNLLKTSTTLELLNRPVVFGNDMQDVASNSLSIAYGDFKRGYQIVDRLGMRVLRNPYIAHPIVRFQAFRRTGGEVKNFEAIKLLKCAA